MQETDPRAEMMLIAEYLERIRGRLAPIVLPGSTKRLTKDHAIEALLNLKAATESLKRLALSMSSPAGQG